jgi:heptose I phosphotransferase
MLLTLSDHLRASLPQESTFDAVLALNGEVFRAHRHRRTIRCDIGGTRYFVKTHDHTGWREILKNVLRGRLPTLTALPEWHAINRLRELGVPTMQVAGIGRRGWNPARLQSFLITHDLVGMIHLDEAVRRWMNLPASTRFRLKRQAILELASIARSFHHHGMNHRDFYLCHFMLPDRNFAELKRGELLDLHVIDLHRVQMRRSTPSRWVAKDLSGLLFSSLDGGITSGDVLRFLRAFAANDWRAMIRRKRCFLRHIIRRAVRLYRSEHEREPRLPAGLASF